MKKNRLIKLSISCLFLGMFCFPFDLVQAISNSRLNTPEMIYSNNEKIHFSEYIIINNELYIRLTSYENKSKPINFILKYDDKKIKKTNVNDKDIHKYMDNVVNINKEIINSQVLITDSQHIEFIPIFDDPPYTNFLVFDNNKKFQPSKKYKSVIWDAPNTYMYVDRLNAKIYFFGYYSEQTCGIYVYDINKNKFSDIRVDSIKGDRKLFEDPMRIPNTPYLIYRKYNDTNIGWHDEGFEFWIQEIPEWKAEIEQQRKNEKLYPNAKKYFIDGPANIRDNPKGKSIVYLNDWTEVLVLNQQGDWYEILYANIKGWTYKDNLRIGIKNE